MAENSDRDSVIALLHKLGGDDDAEVLAAGRALHAKISDMGVDWDQLLVPDADEPMDEDVEFFDDDEEDTEEDGAGGDSEDAFEPVGDAAGDMKLIDDLLAKADISAAFREELEGYKEDIEEKEFSAADRNYLQAVQNRLSGNRKSKAKR